MTKINITGPVRELIPEWEDPDTGDYYPEHYVQVIYAEGVGTDGTVHTNTLTSGEAILDYPEFVESVKGGAARNLERDMRSKGVWSE